MNHVVIVTYSPNQMGQFRYLGPYQVAWYVRQHGFNAQVLDFLCWMTPQQRMNLYKKYISEDTKILGFSPFVTTKNLVNSGAEARQTRVEDDKVFEILNEIKQEFPWLKIIIGGPLAENFERMPTKHINCKIEALFKGQGEYTFLAYCNHVYKKGPHPEYTVENDIKIIKWSKEYEISKCRMRFEPQDFVLEGECLPLQLSRGCIFKCNFCQYELIGKKKDDFNRSIELVRESLIYHYEKFGTTRYTMCDDTFNSHRKRTIEFHKMVKSLPFDIEFLGYVRMDLLGIWPEQQEILPDAGMVSCHFGVESLNPDSCIQIGKGWGAKNHKSFLTHLSKIWGDDVIIRCSLIAGLGPEVVKDWESTEQYFRDSAIKDWTWGALGINLLDPLSVFDHNAAKYNYRFPDFERRPRYWENDHTNRVVAKKWCKKTMEDNASLRTPGTWYYAFYRNLGYTKEEILSKKYTDLKVVGNPDVTDRFQNFINNYYNKAISYEPEFV